MVKKNKAEVFQPSGDVRRVQSLGGGRWVRVGDHRGKWHHFAVTDPELLGLVMEVEGADPGLCRRIVSELAAMGVTSVVHDGEDVPLARD